MRTAMAMALKDLQLMRRDSFGMFFIIGFPIMMGVLFGAMYGWVGRENVSMTVAVVDEDQSSMSRRLVDNLLQTGNIQIEELARDEAIDLVRRGRLVGLIAVRAGFGETAGIPWMDGPAIELGIDPSRKAEAGMLEGLVMQSAAKLMAARFQNPDALRSLVQKAKQDFADADTVPARLRPGLQAVFGSLDNFVESWEPVATAEGSEQAAEKSGNDDSGFRFARVEAFDVTRRFPDDSAEALAGRLRSRWDVAFPQAMVWGVLGCAASFAVSIVREQKQGTFLRLQTAPVHHHQILAGKAIACFLTVITVIVLLTALGVGLGMRPLSPFKLAVSTVCIAFCFVGLMMLLSVIGKSEQAVSGAAWMILIVMAMFGGGTIPLMFMPDLMKTLSNLSPIKWSVLALEGSIWRGFSWVELSRPCAVLVVVGMACLAVGSNRLSRSGN